MSRLLEIFYLVESLGRILLLAFGLMANGFSGLFRICAGLESLRLVAWLAMLQLSANSGSRVMRTMRRSETAGQIGGEAAGLQGHQRAD